MLEAVIAVARRAMHAGAQTRADDRLASRARARLLHLAHVLVSAQARRRHGRQPFPGRPLAGFGAFVPCLGAVVETEGAAAALAAEGQEVELVAVGELAVLPDERGVFFVDHGEGGLLGWVFG